MKLSRNAGAVGIAVAAISVTSCGNPPGSTGRASKSNTVDLQTGDPSQGDVDASVPTDAAVAAVAVDVATGSNAVDTDGSLVDQDADNAGSIDVGIGVIDDSASVNSLNWTMWNSANTYGGTVAFPPKDESLLVQYVEFVAGGIAPGSYTVTATGADSNGDPCVAPTGAEAVVVSSLTTTPVRVQLTCAVPTDAAVDCPSITSIAVGPVALEPGQTADLISLSTSVSAGTETYLWTTSCAGATITNATSANATFACGSATGACRITLTVNLDGVAVNGQDAGSVCPGTAASGEQLSDDVFCPVPVISCSSPTPKACVAADGGPFCTTLQLDANNCGSCGTVCPAATPACIAGTCVPPPPPPCTTGPCAPNTVQCQGNTSPAGVCTATEAAFVQQDITAGVATTGGPDPAAGCYSCLLASGCLDDETFGDTGHECGIDPATGTSDLAASFTNGSGTLVDATSTCLATLECLLTTGCANAESGGLTNCFCGSEGSTPSACAAASAVNGPCDAQEAAGFSHPITDPSDILSDDFTNTLEPSGMANQILECGKFVCPQCL